MDNRQFLILISAIIIGSLVIVGTTLWLSNNATSATPSALPSMPVQTQEIGIQKASY